MRRLPVVLSVLFSVWLLVAVIDTNAAAANTVPSKAAPSDVVPHWHRVASGLSLSSGPALAASSSYLALKTTQNTITLLNTATNQETPLSPPNCQLPDGADFGGPWLAVNCEFTATTASGATFPNSFVDVLDLSTGQWTTRLLDPGMCQDVGVGCGLSGVGSTWLRFATPPPDTHNSAPEYLQNIATGAVKNDLYSTSTTSPTAPQDNLNNASGVSHPCTTLPGPALNEDFLGTPNGQGNEAYFSQLGHFVLTTGTNNAVKFPDVLQACGSSKRTDIPEASLASSDIIVWPTPRSVSHTVSGLLLPGLRSFVIENNKGSVAAVSNSTVYELVVDKATNSFDLWATTVPNPTTAKNAQTRH